jgi:hypothetical protein
MNSFVTDTADAFANLTTATASDRQLMADLAATNKALTKQLAEKDVIIAQLQSNQNTGNNDCNRNRRTGQRGSSMTIQDNTQQSTTTAETMR